MEYSLDNYAEFETELTTLEEEARKKKFLEKQANREDLEVDTRLKTITGYFLRLSWRRKKDMIIALIRNIDCITTIHRCISYLSLWFGKMATYTDVSTQCKLADPQIIVDHDRSMQDDYLESRISEDVIWMASLPRAKQLKVIMCLLKLGGGGLQKKIYIPAVKIYNEKVRELERSNCDKTPSQQDLLKALEESTCLKSADKYPKHHHLTIAVDKLRKKWDDMILKHAKDVFGPKFNENPEEKVEKKSKKPEKAKAPNKKDKKKGGKGSADYMDWIQMLPIWIIKKILDHFDNKTLLQLKKVNSHWAYVCDSLIKDRHGKEFLDQAIAKMLHHVDPDILKQYHDREKTIHASREPECPTKRRINKLLTRGAVVEKLRPQVPKSKQTATSLVTSLPHKQLHMLYEPVEKMEVFPRLIKEDLLLYKAYPCILKDLDILIDVEGDMEKQRATLSYSLSQKMSDTFSLSQANLADW